MDSIELLRQVLDSQAPNSIICCGELAERVVADWVGDRDGIRISVLPGDAPNAAFPLAEIYDLALITDVLEHLSASEGRTLLGQLRNAGARRIAVLAAPDKNWRLSDFIALGFKRAEQGRADPVKTLYTYDIASYNHKRKWNNADHWANPHMWDKARW